MTDLASFIVLVLALVAFGIGAVDVRTPPSRPNWQSVGLMLLTFVLLIQRGK